MDSPSPVNPDPRSALPSVEQLRRAVQASDPSISPWAAREASRGVIDRARSEVADRLTASSSASAIGRLAEELKGRDWVALARREARALAAPHPRRVVNASGVVLHTNLGRSPIARGAAQAAAAVAAGYSDLELDLASGGRGQRLARASRKLAILAGSEAALACNNCAAAVLLALDSHARGREVIVSRGELVEIGGSFRVPAILEKAGVRLVEVGTTNRTHASDYEQAIGPGTALLLKVHRSNFEQRGFVAEVPLPRLVDIGRAHGLLVMEDLGSGHLADLGGLLPAEADVRSRLALGPDLVCFSGDKLMGGPQAGLVVGREEAVAAMRSNPMARALRLDKMTLAALDWTLQALLDGREDEIPLLARLRAPTATLEARAKRVVEGLPADLGGFAVAVEPDRAVVGGGSLPGFELDTSVVALRGGSLSRLHAELRRGDPPIVARLRDDTLVLDLRTVDDEEVESLRDGLSRALQAVSRVEGPGAIG